MLKIKDNKCPFGLNPFIRDLKKCLNCELLKACVQFTINSKSIYHLMDKPIGWRIAWLLKKMKK